MSLSVAAATTAVEDHFSPRDPYLVSNYLAGIEHRGTVISISADTPVGGST